MTSLVIFFSIFISFKIEFCSTYYQIKTLVKLQNRRNSHETIVSIGLGGKWRHNQAGTNTGICLQYNLDILIIVVNQGNQLPNLENILQII